ncbi:MAG: PilZ domain-containing protein [Kofleriaceae bacterium]|nr:PilZ domain-containing protein [Kofleriaceae bacterium]
MEILKVRFRTDTEFHELYQDDLPVGGFFCPTTQSFTPGQKVVVEISAPCLPNKVLVRGYVRSWRPALPRLRVRAGAIVGFSADEVDKKNFLEGIISGKVQGAPKRKYSRLPVELPVQYRIKDCVEQVDCHLSEISVGGATLATKTCLDLESEVILEIVPPGSVTALSISGRAIYHLDNGSTGLKFIYRDAGGTRRLKELVRRLRDE